MKPGSPLQRIRREDGTPLSEMPGKKYPLSMEAARDIAYVCSLWERGHISASKARGLMERIAFEKLDLDEVDPRELDGSEVSAIMWMMRRSQGETYTANIISEHLGIELQRTRELLSRMARTGKAERVKYGVYKAGSFWASMRKA